MCVCVGGVRAGKTAQVTLVSDAGTPMDPASVRVDVATSLDDPQLVQAVSDSDGFITLALVFTYLDPYFNSDFATAYHLVFTVDGVSSAPSVKVAPEASEGIPGFCTDFIFSQPVRGLAGWGACV